MDSTKLPTTTKHYVYKEVEVKLTGQTAQRKLAGSRRAGERIDIIHEITPTNDDDGSWKKWVHLNELYEIEDEATGID